MPMRERGGFIRIQTEMHARAHAVERFRKVEIGGGVIVHWVAA